MHITIPTFAKAFDSSGAHEIYHVHVNGVYHSAVRYSRVHQLHKQLQHQVSTAVLCSIPPFPPKHLLRSLNAQQISERRQALQKYLQAVAQHSATSSLPCVIAFFNDAQVQSYKRSSASECSLCVRLCSGEQAALVHSDKPQSTSHVIAQVCESLSISPDNWSCFALYIVRGRLGTRNVSYVKWLQDYDCPWICLQLANESIRQQQQSQDQDIPGGSADDAQCSVVLHKCCWDVTVEQRLLSDAGAVQVLYSQAAWQVNSGLAAVSADVLHRLRVLQQQRSYKSYVQLAQCQTGYGYVHLDACTSDYPNPDTRVDLKVGQRTIVIVYNDQNTSERVQSVFRATRIRVWRIVSKLEDPASTCSQSTSCCMQFQFEYLLARDHFEWITLDTEQAALLSQCMQSMGAEILGDKGNPSTNVSRSNPTSPTVNPSLTQPVSPSSTSSPAASGTQPTTSTAVVNGHANSSNGNGAASSASTTYESFPDVFERHTVSAVNKKSTGNRAVSSGVFAADGITDDDL